MVITELMLLLSNICESMKFKKSMTNGVEIRYFHLIRFGQN